MWSVALEAIRDTAAVAGTSACLALVVAQPAPDAGGMPAVLAGLTGLLLVLGVSEAGPTDPGTNVERRHWYEYEGVCRGL